MEKFGDLILKATQPQMLLFNLYDDWLETVETHTAFYRLIMILRALHVNNEKTKTILVPDTSTVVQPHHIWPTLSNDQWTEVESKLRALILMDYGKKNNVNVMSLTGPEQRDIILGMEISAPSAQRQQIAEIEKQVKEQGQLTTTTSRTVNRHGDEIVTTTTTNYETATFAGSTDWRIRKLNVGNLYLRSNNIHYGRGDIQDTNYTYTMPLNLLKKLISTSDLRTQIAGYMYGLSPKDGPLVKEIKCIVIPPQRGTNQMVFLPSQLPNHKLLDNLEPLGWIHTQSNEVPGLAPQDVVTHQNIMVEHMRSENDKTICATLSFTPGSCTLSAFRITSSGYDWAKRQPSPQNVNPQGFLPSHYQRVKIISSDKITGFFLVPTNDSWNYNFRGVRFQPENKYSLEPGVPKDFYTEIHRPDHLMSRTRGGANEEDSVVVDDYVN